MTMWMKANDLAGMTGAGEGILPFGARGLMGMVGAGVNIVGRVPT